MIPSDEVFESDSQQLERHRRHNHWSNWKLNPELSWFAQEAQIEPSYSLWSVALRESYHGEQWNCLGHYFAPLLKLLNEGYQCLPTILILSAQQLKLLPLVWKASLALLIWVFLSLQLASTASSPLQSAIALISLLQLLPLVTFVHPRSSQWLLLLSRHRFLLPKRPWPALQHGTGFLKPSVLYTWLPVLRPKLLLQPWLIFL